MPLPLSEMWWKEKCPNLLIVRTFIAIYFLKSRDTRIRTWDPLLPKQVR